MFEIVTKNDSYTDWTTDGIGDNNWFDTRAEALAGIDELRKLGDDWAAGEYDVREMDPAPVVAKTLKVNTSTAYDLVALLNSEPATKAALADAIRAACHGDPKPLRALA